MKLTKYFGISRQTDIISFLGYGNSLKIYIDGIVLKNYPLPHSTIRDNRQKNARMMVGRYLGLPLVGCNVQITHEGKIYNTATDRRGYFSAWITPNRELSAGWHEVTFRVRSDEGNELIRTGEFLVVGAEANFGVISDIDDTLLISHSTRIFRKLWVMLTGNARTRSLFAGVISFYWKLTGDGNNPIFFVSSSEWNLYNFLIEFFAIKELPKGPLLLAPYKKGLMELLRSGAGNHLHKAEKIDRLMSLFSFLPFILIGDSGQRDMEIYRKALQKYPKRIKAIYIRQIRKVHFLNEKVLEEAKSLGVEILLVRTTEEAEVHARKMGYIE